MNELAELASLRDDVAGRRPEDLTRAREVLNAGIRSAGRGHPRRRFAVPRRWPGSRPRPRAALTGAVAVAAAAAAVAAVLTGTGAGPSTPHTTPAEFLTVGYILGRAATAAARAQQPAPRPDQYIYMSSVDTELNMTCPKVYRHGKQVIPRQACRPQAEVSWLATDGRRIWLSVSGYRAGVLRDDQLSVSRMPWGVQPPPITGSRVTWSPLSPQPCHQKPAYGSYDYLTRVPTSPRALRAWLYTHSPESGLPGRPSDLAWNAIGDLLDEMLVPPKLAAALFRVAATIPGAWVVPHATDAAGRPGIAVARYQRNFKADVELIFDPRTYQLLGERQVLAKPVKGQGPVGTVVESTAQLRVQVTNHLPHYHSNFQNSKVADCPHS
jgi:hypothetical protein